LVDGMTASTANLIPCVQQRRGHSGRLLPADTLAVLAPRPTARPTLPFLQLLLRPADPALSGGVLLGIFNPADELVAREWGDVIPEIKHRRIGDQGHT